MIQDMNRCDNLVISSGSKTRNAAGNTVYNQQEFVMGTASD
jgi:hypothetical protein